MTEKNRLPHHHDDRSVKLAENLPDHQDVIKAAELMRMLSDPTRLKIFWILCHVEECVIDIAAMMDMSSPAVSHHLRILRDGGLITSRREGKEMYYRLSDTHIARELHHSVEEVLEISCLFPEMKK